MARKACRVSPYMSRKRPQPEAMRALNYLVDTLKRSQAPQHHHRRVRFAEQSGTGAIVNRANVEWHQGGGDHGRGALQWRNITPVAEFNLFADPQAEGGAQSGVKLSDLSPLGVTHKILTSVSAPQQIAATQQ